MLLQMTLPKETIRLHRHPLSGHSHRVELLLSMLELPYEMLDVDLVRGAHKSPEFLAKNPFGQVPVLEDGDVTLPDSNAILTYLAARYDPSDRWFPRDPVIGARVQQWLSTAAGPLAYGPAAARRAMVFGAKLDHDGAKAIASQLYSVVERYLAEQRFLAADHPTIADLAMYSYTAHAAEGLFSLEPYPMVRGWLNRVEALPRFVPMRKTEV
jgi:glutathione S-transferase